jgi:hypothetical protein
LRAGGLETNTQIADIATRLSSLQHDFGVCGFAG